jgi:hypothetical protein
VNQSNCELFSIDQCQFWGDATTSYGIKIGVTNSLVNSITNSFFAYHLAGIDNRGGSARISTNLFDHNVADIQSFSGDTMLIEFNRTENYTQFYKSLTAGSPIIFLANRIGSPGVAPGVAIDCTGCGSGAQMILIGNVFPSAPYGDVFPVQGGSGALISLGNNYDIRQVVDGFISGMQTFDYGTTSIGDFANGVGLANRITGGNSVAQGSIQCTGTSPSRQCTLSIVDDGATYSIDVGAAH